MSSPSSSARSLLLLSVCTLFALPALAGTQARIVRLSDVQGTVQIDKNTGVGFENAFVNLPITQGTQIRTGDNGRAEIEFEDGSSLRLAPKTAVEFSTLGRNDAGDTVSHLNLSQGMAYVNWLGKDKADLSLEFAHEKIDLNHPAHFRINASPEVSDLAVFKGAVDVDGPAGKLVVEKKKTASFDAAQDDKFTLANNVADAPLDAWDKEASSYHDQYTKNNSSPYGYGLSDLNYYGSYTNVPGYGSMWQPYFTGVGWDPFMDGAWGYYPGFGYMFASAYPWGWLPYRYGNWSFVSGYGWMWQPGGWNNWLTVPRYTAASGVRVTSLVAPTAGSTRTVVVGRGGVISPMSPSRLVVNSGSAGMGIPRGSVQNLGHVNRQVTKSGFAEVHSSPHFSGIAPTRGAAAGGAPAGRGASAGQSAAAPPASSMGQSSSAGHASSAGHTSTGASPHR